MTTALVNWGSSLAYTHALDEPWQPLFDEPGGERDALVSRIRSALASGGVTFVTGPCGVGKSCSVYKAARLSKLRVDACSSADSERTPAGVRNAFRMSLCVKGGFLLFEEAESLSRSAQDEIAKMVEKTPRHPILILATSHTDEPHEEALERIFCKRIRKMASTKIFVPPLKENIIAKILHDFTKIPKNRAKLIAKECDGDLRHALLRCSGTTVKDALPSRQDPRSLAKMAMGDKKDIVHLITDEQGISFGREFAGAAHEVATGIGISLRLSEADILLHHADLGEDVDDEGDSDLFASIPVGALASDLILDGLLTATLHRRRPLGTGLKERRDAVSELMEETMCEVSQFRHRDEMDRYAYTPIPRKKKRLKPAAHKRKQAILEAIEEEKRRKSTKR